MKTMVAVLNEKSDSENPQTRVGGMRSDCSRESNRLLSRLVHAYRVFARRILLAVGVTIGGTGYAFNYETFTTTDGWTFTFRSSDDVLGMRNTTSNGVRYLVGAVSLDGYSGVPQENLVMPSYVRFQSSTYDCYGIVRSTYRKRSAAVYNTFDFSVTTNLVLPSTCRSIGVESFTEASNVVSITFPTSLESIGSRVCSGCRKLKSVSLTSPHLKSIAWGCFEGCSSLESVFIEGNGETVIEDSAFYGCTSLKSVKFGPGVKRIGVPSSSNHTKYSVFENCYKLSEIDFGGVTYLGAAFSGNVGRDVPGTLDIDFGTTAIKNVANGAFSHMYALRSVRFPETISPQDIVLGCNVFDTCTNLVEAVNVPVDNNSYSMFRNCSSLSNVVIAASSSEIGSSTFEGCVALEHVVIPNSVTNIGTFAFVNCRALREIILPASLTTISRNVFGGCHALQEIVLPASVTTIGNFAFGGCSALSSVVLPVSSSLTTIEQTAFNGCSALREMILPASVTTIADRTFNECRSLGRVEILSDAPDFGNSPFRYCTSLTNVVFRGNVAPKKRINASSSSEMFSLTPTDLVILVKAGSKGWTGDENSDEIPSQWTLSDHPNDPKRRISFIPVTVTFSPVGGTATGALDSYVPRTAFGASLPTASWDGHVFLGWFTAEVGGEPITANSRVPDDSATYYAHWWEPTARSVYMTFDANGGSVNPSNAWYEIGEPFGTLPSPVFANRTFAGWFYVTAGEERFVEPMVAVPADVTSLQAKWLDGVWDVFVTNGVVSVWMPSNNVSVRIAQDWFDQKGVAPFLGRVCGDYRAAVRLPTGKCDGAGKVLTVLDDYIMGTDPLNADDFLKAVIEVDSEGKLQVTWSPNLNANGEVRVYKVWGKARLDDADERWACPTNGTHRFFKVSVEMK